LVAQPVYSFGHRFPFGRAFTLIREEPKKKRHGDRGAKKVLAIPRAVLEPESLRETSLPVKLRNDVSKT
ncbi:hypothetical protein, partial [Burkholderia ubonensis]|uniref:hypothetical protein n=1 Tax=Burkholderia ubonensis TaxID=101571 RepID=UPI001E2D371D